MATPFMTAAQVGSYFVTQYYSMLQQRPELVHQLYSDVSTMLRIDGHTREAATAMLQIHALVMSVRLTSIEIKTAHSLESWSGGVIVMVTGSVQIRDLSVRKKFAQTFFLAPQEKAFFVLNDIFHFIEDDQIHPFSASLMGQGNLSNTLNAAAPLPEPVPSYMVTEGMQARDYIPPVDIKENGTPDKYSMREQRLLQAPEVECVLGDHPREVANGFHESTVNPMQEAPTSVIEESIEEPQKHTYASVLRVAKVQYAASAGPMPASNMAAAPPSEWQQHAPQHNQQSAVQQAQQSSLNHFVNESPTIEVGEDVSATEDRGEIKSVYVKNLPPTVSASEIEEEFKKFGRLTGEGVAIRRHKDTEVCYAFVEFEDIASVQSAIKAATVQIAGRQVFIEERRANSSFARGRRGRGRADHQLDSSRACFGGRAYGSRGGSQGAEREFNIVRGNGYYRRTGRQDKGYLGNQSSRNGQST